MSQEKPGDGLWGWLGRQIGHVKSAIKTDVTKGTPQAPQPTPEAAPPATEAPKHEEVPPVPPTTEPPKQVIYREEKAEEVDLPDRPGVKLRRTIIDEVIVEPTDNQGLK